VGIFEVKKCDGVCMSRGVLFIFFWDDI
jgi:hypothetical protein